MTTCCYCGEHTILRLSGTTQHRLVCENCGAPITKMHPLPAARHEPARTQGKISAGFTPLPRPSKKTAKPLNNKKKKKKSLKKKVKTFADFAEDIFDIFD